RAGLAEIQLPGEVVLGVELRDLDAGVGEAARVVGADDRRDRDGVGGVLVASRGGRRFGGHGTDDMERGSSEPWPRASQFRWPGGTIGLGAGILREIWRPVWLQG